MDGAGQVDRSVPRYGKAKEVAAYIGVSLSTVYEMVNDTDTGLPWVKIGGRLLFPWELLDQWLERQEQLSPTCRQPGKVRRK